MEHTLKEKIELHSFLPLSSIYSSIQTVLKFHIFHTTVMLLLIFTPRDRGITKHFYHTSQRLRIIKIDASCEVQQNIHTLPRKGFSFYKNHHPSRNSNLSPRISLNLRIPPPGIFNPWGGGWIFSGATHYQKGNVLNNNFYRSLHFLHYIPTPNIELEVLFS